MSRRPRQQRAAAPVITKPQPLSGQRVRRVEDRRFLAGKAHYLDDIKLGGMLHAVFVRSPHAHARVVRIDVSKAIQQPGVVAVFTGADLEGKVQPLEEPASEGESGEWGANTSGAIMRALAVGTANFVGEGVAMVVAEDPYKAEDGADMVEVEYEPLPAVMDPEAALERGSPKVHQYLESNLGSHDSIDYGDVAKAFKRADKVVRVRLVNQRLAPSPMEPRGLVATFDKGSGVLTVYLSTQDPHGARDELAELLSLPKEDVRVIAPDVGGGFGGKAGVYPEDPVVCLAARVLGRPVKWVESRRENLLSMRQGRGQVQHVELAMSKEGRIQGLKVRLIVDGGAYGGEAALARITMEMGTGVYDIPAYHAEADVAMTNKVPMGAYRGAGRPEAAYLIERSINIAAARMKLDPVKVRRLNYIKKEKFPFATPGGNVYDSGDYLANLEKALQVSDYEGLMAERARARSEGRLVGVGLSTWVEVSSFGPSVPQAASMLVTEEGRVVLNLGGHVHGQGHETAFAQVVADELGVPMEDVAVRDGDTAMLPWSSITAGSRSAALSGGAIVLCARKIREKMSAIAASRLGARPSSKIVFSGGTVFREDQPSKKLRFAEVAEMAYGMWSLPPGMEMTLFAYSVYAPKAEAFPFGTHVAMVEVDKETGAVRLLKYFAVDDAAKMINPLLVEGQVHGGVAQGIGQALTEATLYDGDGQPLTTTLSDYLLPSADILVDVVWATTATPTDSNLLGVKGMGEAGATAATPTVINAVEDALSDFEALVDTMPASPIYIKGLMEPSRQTQAFPSKTRLSRLHTSAPRRR